MGAVINRKYLLLMDSQANGVACCFSIILGSPETDPKTRIHMQGRKRSKEGLVRERLESDKREKSHTRAQFQAMSHGG